MLVAPQMRSDCQQKQGAKNDSPRWARSSRPVFIESARCASGTSSSRSTSRSLGFQRGAASTAPTQGMISKLLANKYSGESWPSTSTLVGRRAQLFGELAQCRLAAVFAGLDHATRKAYLPGVVRHVSGAQDERNVPLLLRGIEQNQHRCLAGLRRRRPQMSSETQLGLIVNLSRPAGQRLPQSFGQLM